MDSHQTRELHEAPIRRLLLRFTIPVTVGMMVNVTYSIVARIFVGQYYGSTEQESLNALAALTISFPIMQILMAFGMMIGSGSAALISIRLGEKKVDEAEKLLGLAVFLFIALSVTFIVFGLIFLEPLLVAFGADPEGAVLPLAKQYMGVILIGVLFNEISFGMNGLLASEGRPAIAMISMLISGLLNILFDYIFIVVLRTDIWGAALGTVLAQAVSSCWIIWYYMSGRSLLRLRLSNIRFNLALSGSMLFIGMPHFVMQSASCFLQAIQNRQLRFYGDIYGESHGIKEGSVQALAVMGIIFVVYSIFAMPLIGLSRGMQPIVGYNTGAKQFHRVRRTLILGLGLGVIYSFVCYIPINLQTEWFISLFAKNEDQTGAEFIALGVHAFRIVTCMLPAVAFAVLISGYFQASGRSVISLFQTLLRQIILLVPLICILPAVFISHGRVGLDGIWYATPISDLMACIYCLVWFVWEMRRLSRLCSQPDEPPEIPPNTEVIVMEIERETGGMLEPPQHGRDF